MEKMDKTHYALIGAGVLAFFVGLLLGRGKGATNTVIQTSGAPGNGSIISDGMPFPENLTFNISGNFPGINSLSNEFFPLFGFVGYRAF
jgi:hypothetical protein